MNMEAHEPLLDAFLEHTGSVYFALGNTDEALLCYKKSLELQESIFGTHLIQLHISMCVVELSGNKYLTS